MAELHPDIEEILLDEQDIKDIVKKVAHCTIFLPNRPTELAIPNR